MTILLFLQNFISGYVNISFLASFDYDPGDPADPIVFNVAPLNPGGHYDVTTGIYTVPIDGVYEFMLHIWMLNDPAFNAYLEVDNVQVNFFFTILEIKDRICCKIF